MTTRKAIPTEVKQINSYSYDDKVWYRWGIKMDNGDVGYYHTTTETQTDFQKNIEVEYLFEPNQYEDKKGNYIVGKIKKPSKSSKSHRYYINSLEGQEYIQVLRQEIKERIKQKHAENIVSIPSWAARYAADICASKGDFQKDGIIQNDENGLYNKMYTLISNKMFNEVNRISDVIAEMFNKLDENDKNKQQEDE